MNVGVTDSLYTLSEDWVTAVLRERTESSMRWKVQGNITE